MHIAMTEATCDEHVRRSCGWKLFLFLLHMLLSRKPRGGFISREALQTRFREVSGSFSSSSCEMLQKLPVMWFAEGGAVPGNDTERRAARAQVFVQMGELSSGRVALEAAEVAPFSDDTLQQLQNTTRKSPRQGNQFQCTCWSTFRPISLSWTQQAHVDCTSGNEGVFSSNDMWSSVVRRK